jgi:sarcosine oxidase subunit beta
MTPDGKAILGQAGLDGFYLACGLSGTGFKKAPAIGQGLTELITQEQSRTVDLNPFRLSRFAEGKPLHGQHEYGEGGHFWQTEK